ncbi:MAG: serine hydrolase [Flavobacteriaceae bacterium]|nr:serine hydrolase [Flavobacteriaceae bacterium]
MNFTLNTNFKFLLFGLFIGLPILVIAQSNEPLSYANEKDIDLDLDYLQIKVDSIMTKAIRENAFPGAQLLVAKNNKIIFHETYGFHTYDSIQKVGPNDIYDLASVTKIAGPLLALMKLYEEDKLDLDKPFSRYWRSWRNRKDKKDLTLRELLAHQAGMEPYIVFLKEVMKKGEFKKRFVRRKAAWRYSRKAFDSIYVKNGFPRKVYRKIKRSKVRLKKEYLYSGLASLIYPQLIEDISGEPYTIYLNRHFYKPLGCSTLTYNPGERNNQNIVPTEFDSIFRKSLVRAWVHDENAALLGGVSGNAGLFGSAKDLAILMQMLVQKGTYAGIQYFKKETISEFIRVQYPEQNNRRGLGFDKPLLGNDTLKLSQAYPAPAVSTSSFGHSGFTGTFVWADPENQMVFIFLSNRVYPTRNNRNLYNLNIRPSLQQLFYSAPKSK